MRTLTIEILNDRLNRSQTKELPEEKFLLIPKMGQYILDTYNTGNRPMADAFVEGYARDMLEGLWNDNAGNTLKFDQNGEFVDGQNRIKGMITSKTPRIFTFKFGLDKGAKAVLDIGKSRTPSDIQKIIDPDSTNRTKKSAIASIIYGFNNNPAKPHSYRANNKPSNPELIKLIVKYSDQIDNAIKKLSGTGIKDVVIETYAYFSYIVLSNTKYSDKVDSFFEKLGSGANLNADDPIFIVHKRLIHDKLFFHKQANKDRTLGLIFKAWNMHLTRTVASNKMKTPEEIPVIIGLDNFDGKPVYL